jgi:hypothetical protein
MDPGRFEDLLGRTFLGPTLAGACYAGDVQAAERFLRIPTVDVNHQGKFGRTALHNCTYTDRVQLTRLLLDQPTIDVNVRNDRGKTALWYACSLGNAEIVRMLLAMAGVDAWAAPTAGPDTGLAPLQAAQRAGHDEIAAIVARFVPCDQAVPVAEVAERQQGSGCIALGGAGMAAAARAATAAPASAACGDEVGGAGSGDGDDTSSSDDEDVEEEDDGT